MDIDRIQGETIFVTGGAGFIGSTLIGRLLDSNRVTVYDNFARNALQEKSYNGHPNLTVVQGDILDYAKLRRAMKNSTYIVHAAAIAGIDSVIRSPVTTMSVNMVGSYHVLQAASTLKNCKRIVCFSTSEVFGQLAFRSKETSPAVMGAVGEARWTYAVSKLSVEHLAYAYYKELGLPTVTVRPFNVYGPGQVGEGALRAFVLQALRGEPLRIHGDGTQIRAWCYIDDMVDGILCAMVKDEAVGQSFNIGNQKTVITVYGLASTVLRVLRSTSEIQFIGADSVDIELRIPNVEKAKSLLGFEAAVGLEEGICRTASFYRAKIQE
ncbi:NAD-dependent epimerase/dehydratase family protein [Paenibacillus sp. LHD-117]|uniref:NAD-dependent epimerase/dehydratase family protein n=1 Tax=Paenibacillus sp. LHD-117 TaxID=3071412 RepID=UPI0027E0A25C|nr:NAD-dependent epimerase/dehydratase family protein [Paenibacillus sp. LHD-117]MDQ6418341.1 NAD-dependent epimerase/dehydratase family protein [Paenibacillus sp. LHD-117]